MKRTFQPHNKPKRTTSGFRKRMSTRGGKAILNARRKKGRAQIAVTTPRKGHYR